MGLPNRGFGPTQPGGWVYNILPYLEEQNLHKFGTPEPTKAQLKQVAMTPVAVMNPISGAAMCIEPPFPALSPVVRPASSASSASGSTPFASAWACARCVPNTRSSRRRTARRPGLYGDRLADAQAEDVVVGTRAGGG